MEASAADAPLAPSSGMAMADPVTPAATTMAGAWRGRRCLPFAEPMGMPSVRLTSE
ncbi:hypothetical protein P376_3601 [Streptomyces sp. HCCB10043]|nr:hypothetical protein P376_3601 [Streptomyces sp. HCCB10043]